VVLSPGVAGPPDTGVITTIPPGGPTAGGMPLAVPGSICNMINSLSGVPYVLSIGPLTPSQARSNSQPLVRIGDAIPSGPGIMTILGPPASPTLNDMTG
jgi:hypothetical protein